MESDAHGRSRPWLSGEKLQGMTPSGRPTSPHSCVRQVPGTGGWACRRGQMTSSRSGHLPS
eukprot:6364639-Prorocentrum_lima.AAC.1